MSIFTNWPGLITGKFLSDFNQIVEPYDFIRQENEHFKRVLLKESTTPKPIDLVISHHIPSYDLVHPTFKNSIINCYFVGDVEVPLNIKAWIYGHTHKKKNDTINGCNFVCNPFGYPNEVEPYWQVEVLEINS